MRLPLAALALLTIAIGAAACSGGGGGSSAPVVPAAPSALAGSPLNGGMHLTWTDNATNEDGFFIERKVGGGSYVRIATEPFDVTSYHDPVANVGTSYTYQVTATNAAGAAASNEATITP